jgi:hypothetical protein
LDLRSFVPAESELSNYSEESVGTLEVSSAALCLVQPIGFGLVKEELMNAKTVVFGAIVFGLASAALSIE